MKDHPVKRLIATLRKAGKKPVKQGESWEAHCPAHNDKNPSLRIAETVDHNVLVHCHAGCTPESIVEALELTMADLFLKASASETADQEETTYEYEDEGGHLLFQVVRRLGKRFLQRRPDANGGWIWNLKGVRRVLYRLPELIERTEESVFLVEGEKDVNTLRDAKLLATTNPGGAGKWRDEYSESLRDRNVVILPDNDEAGRNHTQKVTHSLYGTTKTLKVVKLPGLEEHGDVSDWLLQGSTVTDLLALVDVTPLWSPSSANNGKRSNTNEKETLAERIIRIIKEKEPVLFHDEHNEPYAAAPTSHGRMVLPIESSDFKNWIRRIVWTSLRKAPGRDVLTSVREVLCSIARFEGNQYKLHNRCAFHDDAVWIDLNGRSAIRIEPTRWTIVKDPPILFRTYPHQKPFPLPKRKGDLIQLLEFINIEDENSKLLLLCYMVAAFVPDAPIPALIVHGVQGSAKTTFLKTIKRVLDPSRTEVVGSVRDLAEFSQAAAQNRAIFFDNLTSIPGWLSDAICRAITGEGYTKRKLFTDDESIIFEYRGLIGISGINLVANRSDLLDRSIIIPLKPIPPSERCEEREFWLKFDKARPSILGGLLNILVKVLHIRDKLKFTVLPRMADFARIGAAAAIALGRKPEDFFNAYSQNVTRQNEAAIDSSLVAQVVIVFMEKCSDWSGSPSELLKKLNWIAEKTNINTRIKIWPKNASWLSRLLREVQPNLLALGIEFSENREAIGRIISLRRMRKNGVIAVTGDTKTGFYDGNDSNDGISATRAGGGSRKKRNRKTTRTLKTTKKPRRLPRKIKTEENP